MIILKKRRRDKKTRDQGNIIGKNTGRYHLSGKIYCGNIVAVHITDEPGDGIRRVKSFMSGNVVPILRQEEIQEGLTDHS